MCITPSASNPLVVKPPLDGVPPPLKLNLAHVAHAPPAVAAPPAPAQAVAVHREFALRRRHGGKGGGVS